MHFNYTSTLVLIRLLFRFDKMNTHHVVQFLMNMHRTREVGFHDKNDFKMIAHNVRPISNRVHKLHSHIQLYVFAHRGQWYK